MKVAYITAGAAGMYCGNCLRDNALAAALLRLGEDVLLLPTYTPLRTDEKDVSSRDVFFGALNVYLGERSGFFRRLPGPLRRLLDSPRLLDWVSRRAASVDPSGLGGMTLSMLAGEEGPHRAEVARLCAFLERGFRPDVVHLTNALFLGLAKPLRRALGVPVVCSLSGEDFFVEGMERDMQERVRDALRLKVKDADVLVATSRAHARDMETWLGLPEGRVEVIYPGISLEGFSRHGSRGANGRLKVAYMARISPEKGLHLLAEALAKASGLGAPDRLSVRAAGWMGPRGRAYLEGIEARLAAEGLAGSFAYLGEVNRREKIDLLESSDVLSVPAVFREPKGIYVLESLAAGTPVVVPDHGAFPELIEMTGGGMLFRTGSAADLARALIDLAGHPERAREMGEAGRRSLPERFTDEAMAAATRELYRRCGGNA